ncbi:hypothetical protein FDP41_012126 [Naegleria fowleri]|uniref:Phosphatidate cytidylyltransferase, mitochondrial n=1 Tax=Naegleria fowleri TaxID=5763 RepID=A0A6A5C874_NAEFO|nr:uncharacterized protein FDP41_012126 [Naegleria fowleri]KAF0981469.1 hypothetical protein FDP41_012126 [Naegleria fowleri]CAG4709629.1 unnamed protein product [Naegleria fowleri]
MNHRLASQLPHLIRFNFPPLKYAFAYGSAVFKQKGNEKLHDDFDKILMSHSTTLKEEGTSEVVMETPPPSVLKMHDRKKLMVDMVFVVSDSYEWHKQNLLLNPEHYSWFMRVMGPKVISLLQERFGAKIYYNTMVELKESHSVTSPYLFKYGVIKAQDLIDDLNHWETLYVSGRLQKPTFEIDVTNPLTRTQKTSQQTPPPGTSTNSTLTQTPPYTLQKPIDWHGEILKAQEINLEHALFVSLRMMINDLKITNAISPESGDVQYIKINLFDLFVRIASISYQGDVRMKIKGAENVNKVFNIVTTNYDLFIKLYKPILDKNGMEIKKEAHKSSINTMSTTPSYYDFIEISNEQIKNVIEKRPLPSAMTKFIQSKQTPSTSSTMITNAQFENAISQIVSRSSTSQTLKGILSAGFTKSVMYVWEKIKKGMQKH